MPRPPVKKTQKLAEAQEYGKLMAQRKFDRGRHKWTIDSIANSAREHLGKLIDSMNMKDALDLVAAVGMTPLIYQGLDLLPKVQAGILLSIQTGVNSILQGPILAVINMFNSLKPQLDTKKTLEAQTAQWILAFAIAYCIVKWGDKMIGIGVTSLSGIAGLLGAA